MGLKNVVNKLFPENTRRRKFIRVCGRVVKSINITNIKKLVKIIRLYGFKYAIEKSKYLLTTNFDKNSKPEYSMWIELNEPKKEELVDSMINQTYSNWELCLADRKS